MGAHGDQPLSVVLVCTANICRSAFGQQLAHQLLGDDASVVVTSAGTHGWPAHPVERHMAAELERRGAAVEGFASRALTMDMVDQADLVLTMEERHRRFILDDRPHAVWKVFTLGQLARMIQAVPPDLRGRSLLLALRDVHQPPREDDDVVDPFGRGPEAAATAAEHIERLLADVLGRLSAD